MTDERDPKVSERYRAMPGEEPPRALDQAILAAARRATDKPHAPLVVPAGRHRWYYSLAAAAILVLAIAVTVQVERQQPDSELAVPPPAPAPKVEQPQVQAAPAEPPAAAPALKREPRQERRQAYTPDPPAPAPAAPPPAPAPTPSRAEAQPSADAPALDAERARLSREKAVAEQAAAEAAGAEVRRERASDRLGAAAPQSKPAPSRGSATMAASSVAADSPERELDRIAELRKQGRHDEADKALAEFRKRYPDYQMSREMRDKVELRPAR